jgi:hypothetical protein
MADTVVSTGICGRRKRNPTPVHSIVSNRSSSHTTTTYCNYSSQPRIIDTHLPTSTRSNARNTSRPYTLIETRTTYKYIPDRTGSTIIPPHKSSNSSRHIDHLLAPLIKPVTQSHNPRTRHDKRRRRRRIQARTETLIARAKKRKRFFLFRLHSKPSSLQPPVTAHSASLKPPNLSR